MNTATQTLSSTGSIYGTDSYNGGKTSTGATTKTATFACYSAGSTSATTGTATGVTTGTAITVCATWDTIKLSRRNGLGFCPTANTAESVTISGIVLGVDGENANTSLGTFYEGAIVSGSPTNETELSVMANIKAVRYAK